MFYHSLSHCLHFLLPLSLSFFLLFFLLAFLLFHSHPSYKQLSFLQTHKLTRTYTHIHTHICTHNFTHTHTHIYICIYVCICIFTYSHIHTLCRIPPHTHTEHRHYCVHSLGTRNCWYVGRSGYREIRQRYNSTSPAYSSFFFYDCLCITVTSMIKLILFYSTIYIFYFYVI